MLTYALKRLGLSVLVALAISGLVFLLLRTAGDVAISLAGEGASTEGIENVRRVYGLDRPLTAQYLDWLGRVLSGDFGHSLYFRSDVFSLVADKFPTTAWLALFSLSFALVLSLVLGILAAVYAGSWIDKLCLVVAVAGQALPNFFFALILMMVFAVSWRVLPVSGSATWANFVLPSVALGYFVTPGLMRLVRAGMLEVLASDYIRTARAKGLSRGTIILKHALPNALAPVVALAAVQFGFLLGGSVVIETIFALDGLGYLAYQSISHKDLPVIQAIVTLLAFVYVGLTLVADITNAWLNPRIRVMR